jgi:hypothetical protein
MKTIFTIILVLTTICLKAQHISYMSMGAGLVTDGHTQFSMYAGIETQKEDGLMGYFVEAGAMLQCTNSIVADIASVNLGAEARVRNFFTSVKAGPAYCFNKPVKDVYKPDESTVIIFSQGAEKSTSIAWLASVRVGCVIADMPLYIETAYAGRLLWLGAGVKIVFGQ